MLFSSTGPSASAQPGKPSRSWSSSQIRSSGQACHLVVGPALHVEAAQLCRAHAQQREAALAVRVDQFVVGRRHRRRGCPAKRTGTRANSCAGRSAGTVPLQTPWKPSQPATTSHSSSWQRPSCVEPQAGPPRRHAGHGHVLHLEVQGRSRAEAGGDEVLYDLGLPVDDDRRPSREVAEADPVTLACELELDPVVRRSPRVSGGQRRQPRRGAPRCPVRAPRPYAVLDVLAALALQHHRVDPVPLEQAGEGQTGRAAPRRCRPGSSSLEEGCLALADAHTERGQAVAPTTPAQLVQERDNKAGAAHAEGVPESDRTAVDVHLLGVQAELAYDDEGSARRTPR